MAEIQNVQDAIVSSARRQRPGEWLISSRRATIAASAVALAALTMPLIAQPNLRLVWNVSASVPLGLYRIEPGRHPLVGELAAVRPSPALARLMADRHYVEQGALLVKPVAAVTGARVCRRGHTVTIEGLRVASALDHDRFGRDLPRWSGCRALGASDYFLLARNVRASFDSRYFGPVAATSVIGRATPLWVWL
ncbi:S26 family signal peptidase [Sphingomonas koreensis]|nr:S26 family signal peptidase [Sphingomonas koreensis]